MVVANHDVAGFADDHGHAHGIVVNIADDLNIVECDGVALTLTAARLALCRVDPGGTPAYSSATGELIVLDRDVGYRRSFEPGLIGAAEDGDTAHVGKAIVLPLKSGMMYNLSF